jgi:acetoin utilization deacetylase AcuC-like enzyme
MTKLQIAYTDDYLRWNLGSGDGSHITKPVRAKLATEYLLETLGEDVDVIDPRATSADRIRVESIHDEDYVSQVLDEYECYDWSGKNQDNAETALKMFAGTVRLTENMLAGSVRVGFNPQGAKHHAAYSSSEGFCVFNDMAWAAREFKDAGLKPLYIDWDVHAGDGVQNMLEDTDIPTLSIHGSGIYPVGNGNHSRNPNVFGTTHTWHDEDKHFYNWNLALGSGDEELARALDEVEEVVDSYKPDVILLATGADGHEGEFWGINYTMDGFIDSASRVARMANKYAQGRVLIGGAGGYQAETWTPLIWAGVVSTIYRETV